jgi:hypothetical protein
MNAMNVPVNRSFSPFLESGTPETHYERLFRLVSGHKPISWSDLLEKRVVVILGEAGIGKTHEFKNRAESLAADGKTAFFIPLNLLDKPDGFSDALIDQRQRYEKWINSNQTGFFFLDSVDEARLKDTAAFRSALIYIRKNLFPHFRRVSFFISSRITDWSVPGVQEAVRQHLLDPIRNAVATHVHVENIATDVVTLKQVPTVTIEMSVFMLDPLSAEDAKRLAEAFGATPAEDFWRQVEEGDYEFLATRPLDLEWMAVRWKQSHTLGTYSELIEAAVTQRLTEKNLGYVESKAVLSQTQMRDGAERLAAACVVSGRAYVQIGEGEPDAGTVAAADVLPDWDALEHYRLLGAAVFDEATYGRVKFHHRAVTEYLAACWVERQIAAGLPVKLALSHFILSPYGQPVLIKSRRSVLSWLSALNVRVREFVIRQFPELLMFEGDPERWSPEEVVEALDGYLNKLDCGYRPDWWSYASELRRVARMIPPKVLVDRLSNSARNGESFTTLLTLIRNGGATECANTVFSIYGDCASSEEERQSALITLSEIAAPEHKASITADLLSNRLNTNRLIASGVGVAGIENLDVAQLAQIFSNTEPESEFGVGPMAIALKFELLANLTIESTLKLLRGLLSSLPTQAAEDLLDRAETGRLRQPWIFAVLPDVLLHAFQIMSTAGTGCHPVLTEASLLIEKLRPASYLYNQDFPRLRAEIERHVEFRQHLALQIALAQNIHRALWSLTIRRGLVHLSEKDLDWLIREAMREDLDKPKREILYTLARDIAITRLRGVKRKKILIRLTSGVDADERKSNLAEVKLQRKEDINLEKKQKRQERTRKKEERRFLEAKKAELLRRLDKIRSGAWFDAILWLLNYAANKEAFISYTKVNTESIYRDLGDELGDAFSKGLANIWRQIDVPDALNYLDNRIPWAGLVGLGSVNFAFANGLTIEDLTPEDVTRAAQLCIWEHGRPEPWFEHLVQDRGAQVGAALMPWLEFELQLADETSERRTIDLVLGGPIALKRLFLENARERLRTGKVPCELIQRKLLRELIDTGLISKEVVNELVSSRLSADAHQDPPSFPSEWFVEWAGMDFPAAWRWIEDNSGIVSTESRELAAVVAQALSDSSWSKHLSGTIEETEALLALYRFLDKWAPQAADDSSNAVPCGSPIQTVRDGIPGILASMKGKSANRALQQLADRNTGTPMGAWLLNQVREHASAEAERKGKILPVDLKHFGDVYTRDPRTEGELFDQVMARLEEIREGVEEGPFSDRVLFMPKMREKQLQIWLAARLADTPRRRFSTRFGVTREPQVDNDKRTDIEVSHAAFKVCIEIKPLDATRGYSATSLTGTLKDQLVGQYMKGKNSKHGILVLFRLDNKQWEIPCRPDSGEFKDLLEYLMEQAAQIRTRNDSVERLEVFGINCTVD